MTGIDTGFMIAHEMAGHPDHQRCRGCLKSLTDAGEEFLITDGVIAEFVHVITDQKRFTKPFTVEQALREAAHWSAFADVTAVAADDADLARFADWMTRHQLGRKRILDTLLAATYFGHGATRILTLNKADFAIFGVFDFPLN